MHLLPPGAQYDITEDEPSQGLRKLEAEQLGAEAVSMRVKEHSDRFTSDMDVTGTSGLPPVGEEQPVGSAVIAGAGEMEGQVLLLLLLRSPVLVVCDWGSRACTTTLGTCSIK